MLLNFYRGTPEYNSAFRKARQLFEEGAEISYLDPARGAIVITSTPWRITLRHETIMVEHLKN